MQVKFINIGEAFHFTVSKFFDIIDKIISLFKKYPLFIELRLKILLIDAL